MKNRPMRHDLWLLAGVLVFAAALLLLSVLLRPAGRLAEVRVDGTLYARYALDEDLTVSIDDLCVLQIRGGEVRMLESDCKNQICVHHPAISRGGEMIVCLPNGVSVKILSDDAPDFVN